MKEIFIIKKGLGKEGYVTEEVEWPVLGKKTSKFEVAKQFESYDEALKYLEKDEKVYRTELYQIQKWYIKEAEDERF